MRGAGYRLRLGVGLAMLLAGGLGAGAAVAMRGARVELAEHENRGMDEAEFGGFLEEQRRLARLGVLPVDRGSRDAGELLNQWVSLDGGTAEEARPDASAWWADAAVGSALKCKEATDATRPKFLQCMDRVPAGDLGFMASLAAYDTWDPSSSGAWQRYLAAHPNEPEWVAAVPNLVPLQWLARLRLIHGGAETRMTSGDGAPRRRLAALLGLLGLVVLLAGWLHAAGRPMSSTAHPTASGESATTGQAVQDIAFPADGRVVLLLWGGGVRYSADGGASWAEGTGAPWGEHLAVGAPGEVWAAHGWLGIHEPDEAALHWSGDAGATWTPIGIDAAEFVPHAFVSEPGTTPILAGRAGGKGGSLAYRSPLTDGADWKDWRPVPAPSSPIADVADGTTALGTDWATRHGVGCGTEGLLLMSMVYQLGAARARRHEALGGRANFAAALAVWQEIADDPNGTGRFAVAEVRRVRWIARGVPAALLVGGAPALALRLAATVAAAFFLPVLLDGALPLQTRSMAAFFPILAGVLLAEGWWRGRRRTS